MKLKFPGIILFSIFLGIGFYLYTLGGQIFFPWGDEIFSINYAFKPFKELIADYLIRPDNHPPLYYIILNIVQKILKIPNGYDLYFQMVSIIFHFLTLVIVTIFLINKNRTRVVFLLLGICSSFFFMYAHMIRYYTLAAFIYVLAYIFYSRWLERRSGYSNYLYWIITTLLLAYVDYPSYFLAVIYFIGRYFFSGKIKIKELLWGFFLNLLGILPIIYLNYVYFFKNQQFNTVAAGLTSLPGVLSRIVLGVLIAPYHIIIGEFFNVRLFVLVALLLLIVGVAFFLRIWKLKDKTLNQHTCFIIYNIMLNSVFLTVAIGRYPVFSYSRFLLAAAYILLCVFANIFDKKYFVVIALILGVNVFSIYCNLNKTDFINPIYFFPQNQIIKEVDKLQNKYSNLRFYFQNDIDIPGYFPMKYYPSLVSTSIKPNEKYFYLKTNRLYETREEVEVWKKKIELEKGVRFYYDGGIDNINKENKQWMKRLGLMKLDYKYNIFVFGMK